jgi:hypothetical protein
MLPSACLYQQSVFLHRQIYFVLTSGQMLSGIELWSRGKGVYRTFYHSTDIQHSLALFAENRFLIGSNP